MTVCNAELRALRCINSFLEIFGTNINDFGLVDFDVIMNDTNVRYWKNYYVQGITCCSTISTTYCISNNTLGEAASLLSAKRTSHLRFTIPLQTSSDMQCSVSKQSSLGQLLQMKKLIMWDEAPMINRCAFETLDNMLKDITECELSFGGNVVVFGGNFRQVLPVVKRGTKDDIMKASLVFSELWQYFTQLPLTENMRAKLDHLFYEYLLRIGNGIEREHTCHMIKLPSYIIIDFESEFESLKKLIAIVFPDFHTYGNNLNTMMNRVILTSKNEHVDVINNMLVKEIPREIFTYFSFDEVIDKTEGFIREDFLNSLTPNDIPPRELVLKRNCPVMFLRNINLSEGDKHSVPFKRTQFPIRPCFAMTINKDQGQTLDFVGLYLPEPAFSHGQLYVTLSRARTRENIKVLIKLMDEKNHTIVAQKILKEDIFSANPFCVKENNIQLYKVS
ncbi:uncharacterized protein LOC111366784 [Olea europaea var. sylvestris]|uniref:uncharacterized protein LOC111366784 n=1 Tax=Olea europaea var. sylvestris TaxID=158386 RepID=UPI000C1CF740|nr:uncharacterized protein LOC111366784 [Olea europaea var. sylvestris]